MNFRQWLESRDHNIQLVQRAIKDLAYMLDREEPNLVELLKAMPLDQVYSYVTKFGLAGKSINPVRFASMMKMYVKGNI